MAQTSEDYWGKRMTEREAQWYAKSQQTIEKEMADYYLQAASRIRNDIAVLYARFATDNGIDKVAAQQLIQGDEYRVWRMEMKDYLKQVQITGDKNLLLELNTLAMRSRISRLDKIYGDTMMECAKLAGKIDSRMGAFLGDAFKDNYYHGIYDIGQKMQIRTPIAAMNNEMVDKVLHTPWSGKNYSQRIWKDSDKLAQTIQREMVDAVHRGASVQQMSRMVQDRMQVGRSDATRLVRTELNYVQTQAALDSIRDAGMKYVKFLATLDDRTSEVCQQHDGKIIPIEDAKPGVNIPPMHPHCRSTIIGSLKGDSVSKGMRAARDADGKYMRVPADMNYEEWKRSYIGNEVEQNYKSVTVNVNSKETRMRMNRDVTAHRIDSASNNLYLSDEVNLKPRALHQIDTGITKAMGIIGMISGAVLPKAFIISDKEMQSNALAAYNPYSNELYLQAVTGDTSKLIELQADCACPENKLSTFVHEYIHWQDAEKYRQRNGSIDKGYITSLRLWAKKQLEKLSPDEYNEISKYASKCLYEGKFDEAYTEYRVKQLLRK